jgi:hypothetical protein
MREYGNLAHLSRFIAEVEGSFQKRKLTIDAAITSALSMTACYVPLEQWVTNISRPHHPEKGFQFNVRTFFIVSRILNVSSHTRMMGFMAMVVVAAALIIIYSYISMPSYRPLTVFVALGGSLGVLFEELLYRRDPVRRARARQENPPSQEK